MTEAAETIQGTYTLMTMPDGSEVMMEKLSNGKWVTVESRLEEARWDDTTTKPDPHQPTTEGALTLDVEAVMRNHTRTNDHIDAYLVQIYGVPELIKTREDVRKVPGPVREHALHMVGLLNRPSWNRVAAFL